jgi:hypothetical protein
MSADPKSNAASSVAADPTAAVTAFWVQWMEQSTRGTQALLEAMQSVGDPNALQKQWLDAMSESLDGFMRTPAFMEMMRRNLKVVTDLKVAQDQVVHGAARQLSIPLTQDISGLFERLYSTEQTILHRLAAIEDRLEAIEAQGRSEPNGTVKKRSAQGPTGESAK